MKIVYIKRVLADAVCCAYLIHMKEDSKDEDRVQYHVYVYIYMFIH